LRGVFETLENKQKTGFEPQRHREHRVILEILTKMMPGGFCP
jgi:hypothetical protein